MHQSPTACILYFLLPDTLQLTYFSCSIPHSVAPACLFRCYLLTSMHYYLQVGRIMKNRGGAGNHTQGVVELPDCIELLSTKEGVCDTRSWRRYARA